MTVEAVLIIDIICCRGTERAGELTSAKSKTINENK